MKPYKTHGIKASKENTYMASNNPPTEPSKDTANLQNMTVDEKLNMLISSVTKLETIPTDIIKMQDSIEVIQADLKDIPVLKGKIDTIENDLKNQKGELEVSKVTNAALEVSLTTTQKDMHDFDIKELEQKVKKKQNLFRELNMKAKAHEKRFAELSKVAFEDEIAKSKIANKIQIDGVLER